MLWMFILIFCFGYLPHVVHGSCGESAGDGGSKVLAAPCSFTQLSGKKDWNTRKLQESSDVFFRFEMMNCEKYMESSGMITLTCTHSDSFYIMKRVLSFGVATKTKFVFEFNPSNEVTYNDTKITITGHLSRVLYNIQIQATKDSGNSDFEFKTESIAQMDVSDFFTQRITAAGRELTTEFNNAINTPATNCIMSGIFSGLNNNPNKPESQNFELLITNGNGKEFYIIQSLIEEDTYVIAYYKEATDNKAPRLYMKNVLNVPFTIPSGFSPVFDASASAYGISEDLIVNVNSDNLRNIAEKYVSQSSQGLILKGGNLYWHINDPKSIKILAENVPNVEEPPTPTSETSSLHNSEGKLKADKKKVNKKAKSKDDFAKQTIKQVSGIGENKTGKGKEKQNANFMSLNDYVNQAKKLQQLAGKRTEYTDFTERDKKIALSANFDKFADEEIIEISSPEYLKGKLNVVLQTFMPTHEIPAAAVELSKLDVVFDKIVLHIPSKAGTSKTMYIQCNITQKYDLVRNFISGDGITIIAKTPLTTTVPQGKQQWVITGKGRTEVLQQLINVKLGVDEKGQMLVRGSFEIANMTEFWNATGEVNYLPTDYRTKYPHLTNFALTNLNLKSLVGGEKLRIIGKCLLFSQPKTDALVAAERRKGIEDNNLADLVLPSKVRIIMTNTSSVQYMVGIIGEDLPFEQAIEHLLSKSASGASWVKLRKFGVIMSASSELENGFEERFLKNMPVTSGITAKATLLLPTEEDCKVVQTAKTKEGNNVNVPSDDNPKIMSDATCMFLKDRPALVGFFGAAIGHINSIGYSFESEVDNDRWFKLFPQSSNPIEIKKPTFYLGPEGGSNSMDASLRINGKFKILFNGNSVMYKGSIEFDELKGKLIMKLMKFDGLVSSNVALPFSIDKMRNGFSRMNTDGEFTKFMSASTISVGLTGESRVDFRRGTSMIFDVMDPKKLYFKGFAKNFENNPSRKRNVLLEILKAFGSNLDKHIIFKGFETQQLTGAIYSAADEDFKVKYFEEFNFKKGLNIYGTIKILQIVRRKFHFHYDSDTATINMEVSLPVVKIPMRSEKPKLVLARNHKHSNRGGRLKIRENKQKSEVKFIGYMKTVGIETPIEFAVKPDGKFKVDFNQMQNQNGEVFKLFNQAPCTMTLEQKISAKYFRLINPEITIDFAPANVLLVKATKDYVKSILQTINSYKSSKFNRFMRIVGKSGMNLRDLTFNLIKTIEDTIKEIGLVKNRLNADCVEKCEPKPLSVFGYRMEKGKPVGDENLHQVANVLCIAECEMVKPLSVSTQESLLARVEDMKMKFDELMKRTELMQKLLDLHFEHLATIGHQLKRAAVRGARNLDEIDVKINIKKEEVPFRLTSLRYQKKLSDVKLKGSGSKCIVDIESSFNYMGSEEERKLNLCFNGEFEKYTAREILNNYYDPKNVRKYEVNMDKAAEAKSELEMITEDVIELFEKLADPNFEYSTLLDLIESTALVLPEESKKKKSKKDKKGRADKRRRILKGNKNITATPFKSCITYGKHNISFPSIGPATLAHLKEDYPYSLKSPKSKRAFIYSSPWAALKTIAVHKNETLTNFANSTANEKASYCKRLSEVSGVFDEIRRSLSNYAMSYVNAKRQLGDTNTILQKGLEELKATVNFSVNYKMNKGQRKGVLFWYNQYKRGVNMYDSLMKGKLKEHNDNGLKRWKNEIESSLKKSGVASLDDFLATFQKEANNPETKSNVPVNDNFLGEKVLIMCKNMSSLLKDPNSKLEQASTAVNDISKNFNMIKPKITSCQ